MTQLPPEGISQSAWDETEDVMAWIDAFWADGLTDSEKNEAQESIARAIMAATERERERCALIADEHGRDAGDMAARGYYTSEERAVRNTARGIAVAIRQGSQPSTSIHHRGTVQS